MKKILFFILFISNISASQKLDTNKIILSNPLIVDTLETLIKIAWDNYPENKNYLNEIAISQEDLHQKKWAWMNTLKFTIQYNPNTATDSTGLFSAPKFGIGLSVNVFDIFKVPSEINQSSERLKIAHNNIIAQKMLIRSEVTKLYSLYKINIEKLKITTQGLDDATSNIILMKYKYESGEITLPEYNKALESYNDAKTNIISSETEFIAAKANLEQILGIKFENIFK